MTSIDAGCDISEKAVEPPIKIRKRIANAEKTDNLVWRLIFMITPLTSQNVKMDIGHLIQSIKTRISLRVIIFFSIRVNN